MAFLYLIILVSTLLYLVYKLSTRNFNYWSERNVVGPKPVPLFGNMRDVALFRRTEMEVLADIYKQFPDEKVIGIYKMSIPYLVVKDVELIKHIMIKDFDMFTDRGIPFNPQGFGKNLFLAEGAQWQVLRARFTPLFTSGKLRNMLSLIEQRADDFVEYVAELARASPEHEVHQLCSRYTLASISACAFGLDVDVRKGATAELEMINKAVFTRSRLTVVTAMFPSLTNFLSKYFIPSFMMDYFTNLVRLVVAQRKGMPSDRNDFMDLLLELKREGQISGSKHQYDETHLEIDESLMAAQAFVFYTAGYETSATTMQFMLYQLALNPRVQERLAAEVATALRRHGGRLTSDCLADMPYMAQVFDETLRMYPVADPLMRRARGEWRAPGTGLVLPRGSVVLVPVTAIHYDERYYPEPHKFDPERFSPENSRNRPICAYLPFGQGPRNCIGMRFAKVQSQVGMAAFLQRFRVQPSPRTPRTIAYDPRRPIVGSLGGIHLNILPRTE